jgi:hypothetical protein
MHGFAPILACLALLLSPFGVRGQETTSQATSQTSEQTKAKPEGKDPQSSQEGTKKLNTELNEEQKEQEHELAEKQLKREEHQRILGIMPAFNSANAGTAVPLSPSQKFRLAFKSATDPFTFALASVAAGIDQFQDDYHGYGQGVAGYSKRFGASYLDTFNGTMLGNALLPVVFHQDPRYFRKGTGSVKSRLLYAALSTVRCKGDNGRWQPSYSNLLGNLAAGTISNVYYPEEDRGVGLTFQRAAVVSVEGALGAMALEFWPDISRKFSRRHKP